MEDIMLKVERLIDGINGEDPGGARLYMAQLRDREVGSTKSMSESSKSATSRAFSRQS